MSLTGHMWQSSYSSLSFFSLEKARFPFLDEDVIRILLNIPLWEIANLDQPSGIGDKKILREVSAISFVNLTFCHATTYER
jgi:asparagine synthetase B (glutamine-hydrolysing)